MVETPKTDSSGWMYKKNFTDEEHFNANSVHTEVS